MPTARMQTMTVDAPNDVAPVVLPMNDNAGGKNADDDSHDQLKQLTIHILKFSKTCKVSEMHHHM